MKLRDSLRECTKYYPTGLKNSASIGKNKVVIPIPCTRQIAIPDSIQIPMFAYTFSCSSQQYAILLLWHFANKMWIVLRATLSLYEEQQNLYFLKFPNCIFWKLIFAKNINFNL